MEQKSKPFGLGILVGRFQTFHIGHEYMLEKALAVCERVAVFIGSSQEYGTEKNPFTYETRRDILKTVFGGKIEIYPLPDIGVGNTSKWGDYVLEKVNGYCGQAPDLLVSGKEERRADWFDSARGISVAELYVPKVIEISASEMRSALIGGDRERWQKFTPKPLWNRYEELRNQVLKAQGNKETSSV